MDCERVLLADYFNERLEMQGLQKYRSVHLLHPMFNMAAGIESFALMASEFYHYYKGYQSFLFFFY